MNHAEIKEIVELAKIAGQISVDHFTRKDFVVQKKDDGSKVTSADIEISNFLRCKLGERFPKIPVICEEGELRNISDNVFFLIDPIDGTSGFVAGNHEFCINIALVEDRRPVFGLIYAPLFEGGKMAFCDEKNHVVLCDNRESKEVILPLISDSFPIHLGGNSIVRIITSSRTKDSDIENCITEIGSTSFNVATNQTFSANFDLQRRRFSKVTVEKLGSAIKFLRLLEGKADLYLHFRPSMEWDTAAGQVLVELMGGKVKNLSSNPGCVVIGEDLFYQKADFSNKSFIAYQSGLVFS